jgi:hypothetical protein
MSRNIILCGGGNSIKEGISLGLFERIKDREVWSINFAFLTFNFKPSRQIWVDISFFKNNIEAIQKLYSQGVSCHAKKHQVYRNIPEINLYETTRNPQEMDKKLYIGRMGLSGFFALHLAVKEEPDNIFLLGYDFSAINGKTHYYQDTHKVQSTGVGHPELYLKGDKPKDEVKDWENFTSPNIKSKIYNVSPQSAINAFPKITYQEFFNKLNENF